MTILTEDTKSFHLTSLASIIETDRDMASTWASKHIISNSAIKWVLGKYVEADNANSNGQYWSLADLRMKKPTIVHSPMNLDHKQEKIVGTFVAAEMMYPTSDDDVAVAENPYIESLGAFWKYYFPNEMQQVEAAYSSGMLYISMECIGESVTCAGDNGCGETFSYAGPSSETYCEHIKDHSSYRQLNNPHFLAGALILPPNRPGWKGAEVTEMSALVKANEAEAERIYDEVSKEAAHLDSAQWESLMLNLLEKAHRKDRVTPDMIARRVLREVTSGGL